MTLAQLKQKLQTVGTTGIGEVFFDWQKYLNEPIDKQYPCVLWMLDGAKFKTDMRSTTVQKTKLFTLTAYAIASFRPETQDKITVWDTLEEQFKTYLNAMNADSAITIENIDDIEGRYAGEGLISADREIGIQYQNIVVKMWC